MTGKEAAMRYLAKKRPDLYRLTEGVTFIYLWERCGRLVGSFHARYVIRGE